MPTNDPVTTTDDPPLDAALIAAAVRAELARARISGRQLGRELGLPRTYVARRLSGECAWSAVQLHAIARHLGVDPAVLFAPRPVAAPHREPLGVPA